MKRSDAKLDLSLVVSDRPAVAAGVYTKNLVCAAPVKIDRERTPSDSIRVVAINSGVANACTGDQGDADARQMAAWAAEACGAKAGAGARDVDRRHRLDAADGKDSRRHQGGGRQTWR